MEKKRKQDRRAMMDHNLLTLDFWQDSVTYEGMTTPTGTLGCEVLNISDSIIKKLNDREKPLVFILWGNFARNKAPLITNDRHLIIESAHPSPFSANRGFFGSRPFSRANEFLEKNGQEPVDFSL